MKKVVIGVLMILIAIYLLFTREKPFENQKLITGIIILIITVLYGKDN